MPEGPEVKLSSLFINSTCRGKRFTGKPVRSTVSKCPEVEFEHSSYIITSECRGKELSLILEGGDSKLRLLFRFGMSGRFAFTSDADIPNHAHLQFFTDDEKHRSVLSFVDPRRFGSWQIFDGWGEGRGPDIISDYREFRENVLRNLKDSAFNKPICEVLLNQKYFNGIGNYLRAEILYRANIPPFVCAREALTGDYSVAENSDVLLLCRDVQLEVLELKTRKTGASLGDEDSKLFKDWLQCYNKCGMKSIKDHNGRTVWYANQVGPLVPNKSHKVANKKKREVDEMSDSALNKQIVSKKLCMTDDSTGDGHCQVKYVRRSLRLQIKALDVTG